MPILRRRKGSTKTKEDSSKENVGIDGKTKKEEEKTALLYKSKGKELNARLKKRWNCVDSCYWLIGLICFLWWFSLFLFNTMPASLPQYLTEAITGPFLDPPGVKLAKEGLKAKHPVVFVPGIVTGGLELWEGHQCAEGLFRKTLGWNIW